MTSDLGLRVFDRESGTVTRLPDLEGVWTHGLVAGGDGRLIYFDSHSESLVPDDFNGWIDIFAYDRATGEFRHVLELAADEVVAPVAISGDGRYLVLGAGGGDARVLDTTDGSTEQLAVQQLSLDRVELDDSGRWATFYSPSGDLVSDDSNGKQDVFVLQLQD